MQSVLYSVLIALALVGLMLIGPVMGIGLLQTRKKAARARRRSPLVRDALRGPGFELLRQIEDVRDTIDEAAIGLFVLPLAFVATALALGYVTGTQTLLDTAPVIAIAVVVATTYFLVKLWRTGNRLDDLRAGYDAELMVGQALDQLMRQGAYVFHDVPADHFNIDHLVISRVGVFAVETKGTTKPVRDGGTEDARVVFNGEVLQFPTWATSEPIDQAQRQAKWVAELVRPLIDEAIRVHPVVALPGWFVDRRGRGAVGVYNDKELSRLLRDRGTPLSQRDVERVVHIVEARCRTVEPMYGRPKRKQVRS